MEPVPLLRSLLVVAAVTFLWLPRSAAAHINLLLPQPRYPTDVSGANKACPCGVGLSDRFCEVEGDRSDVARSQDRVTTLVAGSVLTLRFDEYIGHAGRMRVAFDEEGADQADFDAHVLLDVADPAGGAGNVDQGSIWELQVQVPSTPCDHCTIQLVQMMDGNTEDPVASPIGRSSYYQCADVVIVAPEAGIPGDAGLTPEPDWDAGMPSTTDSGSVEGGDGMPSAVSADTEVGGCSAKRTRGFPGAAQGLVLLVLGLWRRRCQGAPLRHVPSTQTGSPTSAQAGTALQPYTASRVASQMSA